MARDTQSIVKMSRREGYALHPKAHKALVKRPGGPGQHGAGGRGGRPGSKTSQYALQLREKQKVKRLYGLLEKQFSNLMAEASRKQGQSGQVLLQFLEQRLDNAIYRAGYAPSRRAARQLVTHGHFMLNDRRTDIPSIRLRVGDKITLRDRAKQNEYFKK
ncbi:MAG TPA: 30S ribosomal protein S4, partial [Candidatus Saccharimonadales bacterium]|nr:30S ribosomal protein S4 [Candidatus Saccharimonadales bacterium]